MKGVEEESCFGSDVNFVSRLYIHIYTFTYNMHAYVCSSMCRNKYMCVSVCVRTLNTPSRAGSACVSRRNESVGEYMGEGEKHTDRRSHVLPRLAGAI